MDAKKLPISAVMAVYHGEKTIERALRSVVDLVDELIVSHNGPCQDRSVEIAQRYTDKVFVQPEHIPAPEPYRVFLYQQATHDWILQIDCDEYLTDELRRNLNQLIQEPGIQGYEFVWPTWYRGAFYNNYYKTALVNKRYFYLIGAPSEYLKPVSPAVVLKRVPLVLGHQPHYENFTWQTFRNKWLVWARARADYFCRDFADIPKYNYSGSDWEPLTRVRIDHPILLGIIGTGVYNLWLGVWYTICYRRWLFFKISLLTVCHDAVVYYLVYTCQRQPNKSKR